MSEHGPHYAAQPMRCRACETRDGASRQFADGGGDTAGIYFVLETDHSGGE